jgi:hypothetical protein
LPEGSLIVNSSQGGGSKDTWVLAPSGEARERLAARQRSGGGTMIWTEPPDPGPVGRVEGQQAQQQQQQRQQDVTSARESRC